MDKYVSPYYPPRARWYARLFYLGTATRHKLALDKINLPRDVTVLGLLASILIPGLGAYLRGPRFWGKVALAVCALLFLCFIIWLGYPFGNYVFGMMISIHVSGFTYYCSPYLREKSLAYRMVFTVLVLIAVGFGIFLPIRNAIQNHWLMPMRNGNQVIIVSAQAASPLLKNGEWAAFETEKGTILGKIIGSGGDVVNSTTVPKNHWLVRAQFVKKYYHDGFPATYAGDGEIVEQDFIVSPEEFVGKPFDHWFWRKQILP